MGRGIAALLALLVLSLGFGSVAAQESTPASESLLAGLGYPDLVITTDGTDFTVPAEVAAGRYRLVLQNDSELAAHIELYQLPAGITPDDLVDALAEDEPPVWAFDLILNGGVVTQPGQTGEVVLDLTPGEWVFNLFTSNELFMTDEDSLEEANLAKSVTVSGEMPTLADPAGAVEIDLIDFEFVVPDNIAAGPQIWKVANKGEQWHHLILSQVPDGTTEDQALELISSFFAPPATPEAGATPVEPALGFEDIVDVAEVLGTTPGRATWIELDLTPGTYAALCFFPTPDGTPHLMLGMIEVFAVA